MGGFKVGYSSNLYMITSKEGYEAIYYLIREQFQITRLMRYKSNEFVFMEIPDVAEELVDEIVDIMEGGYEAFKRRNTIYSSWEKNV